MVPNFLIIGAPKAATTWMADGLREHPDVFVPQLKELRFFCGANYGKGDAWYRSHFRGVTGESAVGEASPSYLGAPEAPARIASLLPEAKLMVSVRHPVEQAYSFFWHRLTRGMIPPDTDFRTFFDHDRPRAGYYGMHIANYLRDFPREQLLILLYEQDILQNPRQGMRRCYEFLGVDQNFTPSMLKKRSNAKRDVTVFHGAAGWTRKCMRALPRQLAHPLRQMGKRVLKSLPKRKLQASLDRDLGQRLLRKYYLDDIRQLESILGMDFSEWYEK